ncbi:MAG: hypothetical protein AAF938_19690 [Myxococcota bacterium]
MNRFDSRLSVTPLRLCVALVALCGMACGDDDGGAVDAGPREMGTLDMGRADEAQPDMREASCGDGFCDMSEGSDCPVDCGCTCDTDFECTAGCDCDPECEVSECVVARCEGGVAVTCDGEVSLDCNAFGSGCADFIDAETDAPVSWCGCGPLGEGEGLCLGSREAVICEDSVALPAECPVGTLCDASAGIQCVCDDRPDGVCPDPLCVDDPDCDACVPSCGDAVCGENGCGGSCGSCSLGERCEGGACTASCTPDCDGRSCGSDGCGGTCGSCTAPATCNGASGQCEAKCVPSCEEGQTCGSDGCGGRCGSPCPDGRECRDCASGATCEVETFTCRCSFFDRVSYTFDASGLDWTDINFVTLNYRHINLDGTTARPDGAFLNESEATESYSALGCEPRIRVSRQYSIRGGRSCEIEEVITATNIVIPQPIFTDSGCTAPPIE